MRLRSFVFVLVVAFPLAYPGAAQTAALDAQAEVTCPPEALETLSSGAYATAERDLYLLSVFEWDGERRLFFTDYVGMWRGELQSKDGVVWQQEVDGAPEVRLLCEGTSVHALEVFGAGMDPVTAARVDLLMREVTFKSGDLQLSGTFYAPAGRGTLPGIVYIHGSGPSTRHDFSEWGLVMATRGIASLAYDKRGAGESEGDWRTSTFQELAGDAVAALASLQAQPEVAPERVGLLGASQGAWIAPIAAGRSEPAFVIISGGGPVTPADQEFYRRLRLVEESGVSAKELGRARETLRLWFSYLREPDSHAHEISALWAALDVAERSWRTLIDVPSTDPTANQWPKARRRFARELHFDPVPSYRALDVPVLGLVGLRDQAFPVDKVLEAYDSLPLDLDLTVATFPGADHGYFVDLGPGRRNQAPEVFEVMSGWIKTVTKPSGLVAGDIADPSAE